MSGRPGFALVVSVLMIAALAVLGLGVLTVGAREVQIAMSAERLFRVRTHAESLARTEFAHWSTRRWSALPAGEVAPGVAPGLAPGPAAAHPLGSSSVARLDQTVFLVRTEAREPGAAGAPFTGRAALLIRAFPASHFAPAFPAALASAEPVLLSGGELRGRPAVMAPEVVREGDAKVAGEPPVLLATPPPAASPDLFDLIRSTDIRTRAAPARALAPRPLSTDGECVPDAWNWGAVDAEHPCFELWPVVHADSDLEIAGGQARALVVVEGDLLVRGDTRIEGVLLVAGTLVVEAGASVVGGIRARAAEIRGGTVLQEDQLVQQALSGPALDRAFRPATRWWLPVF